MLVPDLSSRRIRVIWALMWFSPSLLASHNRKGPPAQPAPAGPPTPLLRQASLAQCLLRRSPVVSVEKPEPSLQLFLLRHEPHGENVIDERVESPQLFNRHAFKRLSPGGLAFRARRRSPLLFWLKSFDPGCAFPKLNSMSIDKLLARFRAVVSSGTTKSTRSAMCPSAPIT